MSAILWALVLLLAPLSVDPACPSSDAGCAKAGVKTAVVKSGGDDEAAGQIRVMVSPDGKRAVARQRGSACCAEGGARAIAVCDSPPAKKRIKCVVKKDGEGPVIIGGAAPKPLMVRKVAGPPAASRPEVWIGVRMTAVPKPLAAHVGETGVMITNVVVDSPADEAGLQLYDVVVGFDGKEIASASDLTDVLGDSKAGRTAKLTVIRKGEKKTLAIKPVKRPGDTELEKLELKYDEPEDVYVDNQIRMRGLALDQGPGGHWVIKDLGDLHGIQEMLEGLGDLDFDFKWKTDADEHMMLYPGEEEEHVYRFFGMGPHGDEDVDVTLNLTISTMDEDGVTLSIQMRDGKIHVQRTDGDGEGSSETYESEEEFKEEDPQAYETYKKHALGHQRRFVHVHPFGPEALKLQEEFQINVSQKMREAMEQAREAVERAHEQLERIDEMELEELEELKAPEKKADTGALEILGTRMDETGATTVYVRDKDGNVRKYEFSSKKAFREAEPELYERAKGMLK